MPEIDFLFQGEGPLIKRSMIEEPSKKLVVRCGVTTKHRWAHNWSIQRCRGINLSNDSGFL